MLRAFETGGFTYVDVRSQLKLMLSKGASPSELIETLRRRERIEPLPPQAHEEVLRLLHDAAEQSAANSEEAVSPGEGADGGAASPAADIAEDGAAHAGTIRTLQAQLTQQTTELESLARAYERTKDVQTAASERVTALAAELAAATRSLEAEQHKTRETGKALAERTASAEAHQARGEELLRKSKDYEIELRAVHESLAAREADITALREERAALTAEVGERNKGAPQLLADLHSARTEASALAADLADARALLETEQRKALALEQTHAESLAAAEPLRAQMREAKRIFERYEADGKTARMAIAERDAKLIATQQEQTLSATAQKTHADTLLQVQNELRTARTRADALVQDLNSSRGAAATLDAQLKRSKFDLEASRNELASVKAQAHSYFDLLRTREWRRASEDSTSIRAAGGDSVTNPHQLRAQLEAMQAQLDGRNAEIVQLRGVRNDSIITYMPAMSAHAVSAVPAASAEPADMEIDLQPGGWAESQAEAFEQPLPSRAAAPRKRFAAPRAYAMGAIALVLAGAIWLFVHKGMSAAPVATPARANAAVGSVIHDCPTCPAMVVLPTGRFKQGANEGENTSAFDKPRHWVAISHPLAMSMNAVTLDEYSAFVAATGRDAQGCDIYDGAWKRDPAGSWKTPGFTQTGSHPVTCVSWNDAQAYASWVSSKAGHTYRLPTASEWEYAARAGSEAAAPWGAAAADTCANANVADQSAAQQYPGWSVFGCSDGWVYTAPVGSFKANKFALNDMLGNVFQWTQDCWKPDYVGAPIDGSARTDGNCAQRELRGGSWFSNPSYVRTNYRNHFATDYRTSSVGIRLVREIG